MYLFKVNSKNDLRKMFFLPEFKQVFVYWFYFNSVYITPVGTMLSNNFLTDVNIDAFSIL